MKKLTPLLLLTFLIAGAGQASAQMSAEKVMSSFNKIKGQYDSLMEKWKPVKDLAVQNADKLSPELKTSMQNLDTQISNFESKITSFPTSSLDQQTAMIGGLKTDYADLKKNVNDISGQIKKLKLPKI